MSDIEELKEMHQKLIDQAEGVMGAIDRLKEDKTAWKPSGGCHFYYIDSDLVVEDKNYSCGSSMDELRINGGNFFESKQGAEKAALRVKVELLLRKEAARLNTKGVLLAWFTAINDGRLTPMTNTSWDTGRVMFSSEEAVREAAKNIGVDLIKKAWSRD